MKIEISGNFPEILNVRKIYNPSDSALTQFSNNPFFVSILVWWQYVGEVGKSITVVFRINSVYRVPNIIEIGHRM